VGIIEFLLTVDPASGHPAEHSKGVVVRIEQHLVRLERIGAQVNAAL